MKAVWIAGVFVILMFFLYLSIVSIGPGTGVSQECPDMVNRENMFCSGLDEFACQGHIIGQKDIPGGGHCRWNVEASVCHGSTGGCD